MSPFLVVACVVIAIVLAVVWRRYRALQREEFIRSFTLPTGLFARLRRHHPALTDKDCQLVARALRQFFLSYLRGGRKFVAMPSQVVDDLWHEFILYTAHYRQFCRQAFGRFLDHTPAVVLGSERVSNAGLRRCWWHACREENINPRAPTRLPLLFAIDGKLAVANGFHYVADCSTVRRIGTDDRRGAVHCGTDFADGSFAGGDEGFGDSSASDGGGGDGGDGGGCGGGGCGGE